MTADERVQYLEKQIRACMEGRQNVLNCPWCGTQNEPHQRACCKEFAAASLAVCDRMDQQELIDRAARIADKSSLN